MSTQEQDCSVEYSENAQEAKCILGQHLATDNMLEVSTVLWALTPLDTRSDLDGTIVLVPCFVLLGPGVLQGESWMLLLFLSPSLYSQVPSYSFVNLLLPPASLCLSSASLKIPLPGAAGWQAHGFSLPCH